MSDRTVHVFVEGRVQGVWFRGWTEREAGRLGLSGWVRNRRDGRVEALFAGPADAVERMIDACHDGPPAARVQAVRVEEAAPPDEGGFRTLPTE